MARVSDFWFNVPYFLKDSLLEEKEPGQSFLLYPLFSGNFLCNRDVLRVLYLFPWDSLSPGLLIKLILCAFEVVERTLIVVSSPFIYFGIRLNVVIIGFSGDCRWFLFIIKDGPHHSEMLCSPLLAFFVHILRLYFKLVIKLPLPCQLLFLYFLSLYPFPFLHLFHLSLQLISVWFHFILFNSFWGGVFVSE